MAVGSKSFIDNTTLAKKLKVFYIFSRAKDKDICE
jgi:hypothetical protein